MRLLHLIIYLCLLATMNGRAEQLHSRHISTADGLSGNTINEMVQDDDGYIWMATNNGLSRFDGYSTVNYASVACDDSRFLQARIGRIYLDSTNKLLWLNTSTYQVACYDLLQARFVDWTGCGEWQKSYNKMMLTRQGMVVYGPGLGARIGQHVIELPDNDVLTVVEDSSGTVWLPTKRGIPPSNLPRQGEASKSSQPSSIVDSTSNVIAACSGKRALFLTNEGDVLTGFNGTLSHLTTIPAVIGRPNKVNVNFEWQGYWLLFTPDGTLAVDLKTGATTRPQQWQVADGLNQGTCEGYHFVGTRKGELWIFPDEGNVRHFQLIGNATHATNKGWLFHIAKDRHGHLFIATYGAGLYVYDPQSGTMNHYTADDRMPVIGSDYLMSALTDRQGNIWIGSETAGAYCLTTADGSIAQYIAPKDNDEGEWGYSVASMTTGRDGSITIGMRNGSIYRTPSNLPQLGEAYKAVTVAVAALFTDSEGRQWMGTWGNGMTVDGEPISVIDSATHAKVDIVIDFAEDADGNIWFGTWNYGAFCYDKSGKLRQLIHNDINLNRVNDIETAADGTLWMATNGGLCRLSKDGTHAVFNTTNSHFPCDETNSLLLTGDTLWVATSGGLLQCKTTADGQLQVVNTYSTSEGLSNNNTAAIVQDADGNIWVGSEDGISRIVARQGTVSSFRFASSAPRSQGLSRITQQGNIISKRCAMRMADGRLLFGTADGLLVVDPQKFNQTEAPRLLITNMTVNGINYLTDRPNELNHQQNALWFTFSSFTYNSWQRPVFQYYLEGKEKEWQNTTEKNYANYNELSPGHYVFHVRTINAAGQWQQEVTTAFTILQPWYNRWWAWMLYALALLLAALYVYRNARERFRLHQQMAMERQMSDLRQNLFTNITHEFRTPLAIIKGAVDRLAEDGSNKTARQTAQRATNRMLRMVNQFLEFRKIRTGKLRLQVEKGDLAIFVRDIVNDLWMIAQQKSQQLTFIPAERHIDAVFDTQMVETIVYNLLSNAIKYTPEHGDITVRLKRDSRCEGESFVLTVEDNGSGISEEQQQELFKPFMNGYAARGGMGIGLYTAHEMAAIHKGSLTYECAEQGGSCFTLTLPATDVYSPEEWRAESGDSRYEVRGARYEESGEWGEVQPDAFNDHLVAIIEDNADMMTMISSEVGVYFKTVCYTNGKEALEGIRAQRPSLVISDVMLPDTDGYEIVRQLKGDAKTATLPIIMLTALNDENHQINAYKAGADDYMVKPCNYRLLIARSMQLIKWSTTVSASTATDTATGQQDATAAQPVLIDNRLDKVFLEKLELLTNQHLNEETFTVDRLAEMMSMGRTKFYGKVKELTGMSPNKYLQEARMRRAGELLLEGRYTVSEVSYKVGIQDPSYFNKVFKVYFGVVPSKYGRSTSI